MLLAFGAHAAYATAAYDVHLPAVNRRHFGANHLDHLGAVHEVSRTLVSALNDLDNAASGAAGQMFALVHPVDDGATQVNAAASPPVVVHHDFALPPGCRLTTIRLRNTHAAPAATGAYVDELNCCGDLRVFEGTAAAAADCEKGAPSDGVLVDAGAGASSPFSGGLWLESPVAVSVWRDKPVNGKPIWI